jgi:DNA replication protein DnaC
MTKFRSFRYWSEKELLSRIRQSISEDSKGDYAKHLSYLIDDELVIIDDIGSTGTSDFRKEILFDILDFRYNSMLPTVLTSNYSSNEVAKLFHGRVHSRMFAKENTIIEIHDGVDNRLA